MLFTPKETVEEKITRILLQKERSAKALKGELSKESEEVTIQAVYKALRLLISQEVVIKRKFIYVLSEDWRSVALRRLELRGRIELAEGERISFDLASLIHLDQQWKNIILPLSRENELEPVFMYNPHYIWVHLSESRRESEHAYFQGFQSRQSHLFCLIGGATSCDKESRKELQNEYVHVELGSKSFHDTEYPTLIGDYIITTKIAHRLAQEIETTYVSSTVRGDLEARLSELGIERGRTKLLVERNHNKARKLRRRIAKNFAVPYELVKKFDLY